VNNVSGGKSDRFPPRSDGRFRNGRSDRRERRRKRERIYTLRRRNGSGNGRGRRRLVRKKGTVSVWSWRTIWRNLCERM